MNIKFDLVTLGWFNCHIETNDTTIKIGVSSDYGDKFQELLTKLFDTMSYSEKAVYTFEVIWDDDMCQYHWLISIDNSSIYKIQIIEKSVNNEKYSKNLISIEIEKKILFSNIYNSLASLYEKFGLIGYKKVWEVGNFPIYEYLFLKSEYIGVNLKSANDSEEWTCKIDTMQEIELLSIER